MTKHDFDQVDGYSGVFCRRCHCYKTTDGQLYRVNKHFEVEGIASWDCNYEVVKDVLDD